MDFSGGWVVRGGELGLRDNEPGVSLQCSDGLCVVVSPESVIGFSVGGVGAYHAGWLAGATQALSGVIVWDNLLRSFDRQIDLFSDCGLGGDGV